MANAFDVNRSVAMAHVGAEQTKGWFLANAKRLLVLLSGAQLFCGVVALAWTGAFAFDVSILPQLVSVLPIAVVGGLLAVCIEGGTIFSSAMHIETKKKVRQELKLLDHVKKQIGSEEYETRKRDIERQAYLPQALMFVCVLFSVTGAEIFWQRLFDGKPWFFHVFGAILGIVCSTLLIIFEMNGELVERVIERCITSSGLIQTALDQSAKSEIHDALFVERTAKLRSPEFRAIISKAAEQGLLGVVTEAVNMAGMTVSAEQLGRMVEEEQEVRDAAEKYITSGGEEPVKQLPQTAKSRGGRVTKNRRVVEAAMKKYGAKRMRGDLGKYAEELEMDVRTLERWMNDIEGVA